MGEYFGKFSAEEWVTLKKNNKSVGELKVKMEKNNAGFLFIKVTPIN